MFSFLDWSNYTLEIYLFGACFLYIYILYLPKYLFLYIEDKQGLILSIAMFVIRAQGYIQLSFYI